MGRTLLAMVGLVFLLGSVVVAAETKKDVLRGKVVSVNAEAKTVVVKPREGADVTVTTDAETKVKVDGKDATLADLKADMMVEVAPATGTAKTISARTAMGGEALRGKVVSVDAEKKTLVVKPKEGADVTVTTDAETKVKVNGKDATLADVKADMYVEVTPKTGTAKTVSARSPKTKA